MCKSSMLLVAGLLVALVADQLTAGIVALAPTGNVGGQVYDNLFGEDFNVNAGQTIRVTQLGVFDNNSDGVLHTDSPTQPVVIQLWNRDTGVALATLNFGGGSPTGTDTAVGSGMVFLQNLATPLVLSAGNYYISEDYSSAEQFINNGPFPTINDGGGAISFVGTGRASNGHDYVFPVGGGGFTDGGPANRYTGPNFAFVVLPEPSSCILLGLSVIGLVAAARRRRAVGVVAVLAIVMAACSVPAQAASIQAITSAENDSNGQAGTFSVGWDFSISTPILVTSLGKFDIGGSVDAQVGLYAHGGALLTSTTVLAGDPTQSVGSLTASYHSIAPILLPAGDYVIYGQTGSAGFVEGSNSTTFAPGITWNTGVASFGSSDSLPATAPSTWPIENSVPSRYFGPTFQFTPTPEPGSLVLFGLGAVGLFLVARRRRG